MKQKLAAQEARKLKALAKAKKDHQEAGPSKHSKQSRAVLSTPIEKNDGEKTRNYRLEKEDWQEKFSRNSKKTKQLTRNDRRWQNADSTVE